MPEEILRFTAEHVDACAHLLISVFNCQPWKLETARMRLSKMLNTPGFVGFVLFRQELLGFVVGCSEQGENGKHFKLKEICVRTDSHGLLIATKLLHHLERTLAMMNVNLIYLQTMEGGQIHAVLDDTKPFPDTIHQYS
jgi:ribosomal protein S18 acetylase RimI-like enzyme